MPTSTRLLAAVVVAAVLSQPSPAWAQPTGPNLTIILTHSGNFTVGVNGICTIVITNIGGTATDAATGSITVNDSLSGPVIYGPFPGFTFVSMTGTGLICDLYHGQPPSEIDAGRCASPLPAPVIAPGGSIPITLTVRPTVSGTVTNTAFVTYADLAGGILHFSNNTATDVTIVLAGVPTLPQWALIALTVCLALAGVLAMRRRMA